jgi:hypothetical protein
MRVIHSDNGVLVDISAKVLDFAKYTYTPAYTNTQDYIYVASEWPLNSLWFELGTVNAVSSVVNVELWFNNAWTSAVDIIDNTALLTGKSLEQSESIEFGPHIDRGWTSQRLSAEVQGIASLAIYNHYWLRFSWNATLTAGMTLKFIGTRFSRDTDLYLYYPDLANTNLMGAFATGKTTWDEQHFIAADAMLRQLRTRRIIQTPEQLMDWERFREASIHKVAEIAYRGLGPSKEKNMLVAREAFSSAFDMRYFGVDFDGDGRLATLEARQSTAEMTR